MWIINQEGDLLCRPTFLITKLMFMGKKFKIIAIGSGGTFTVGMYGSEKRCKEVLNDITGAIIIGRSVYRMPME